MKKSLVFLLLVSFVFCNTSFVAFAEPKVKSDSGKVKTEVNTPDESAKLKELEEATKDKTNNILFSELKMLQYKYKNNKSSSNIESPPAWLVGNSSRSVMSPLLVDIYGGFRVINTNNDFSSNINILTGAKAIDESLQLGSIGTDREIVDWKTQNLKDDIEFSLRNYRLNFKKYPESLNVFKDLKDDKYLVNFEDKKVNISEFSNKFDYLVKPIDKEIFKHYIYDEIGILNVNEKEELNKLDLKFKIYLQIENDFFNNPDNTSSKKALNRYTSLEREETPNSIALIINRLDKEGNWDWDIGLWPQVFCWKEGASSNSDIRSEIENNLKSSFAKKEYFQGINKALNDINNCFKSFVEPQTFTLELKKETKKILLSDIKPLEIKSHPWNDMIAELKDKQDKPEIFKLIPEDDLAVYFSDINKFYELEGSLKNMAEPANIVFNLKETASLKDKITKRLGLDKFEDMKSFIKDFAFVSDDLSFYPRNNYAVILNFKSDTAKNIFEYLNSNKNTNAKIGDYYVVSTNKSLLDEIQKTYDKKLKSMFDASDFEYAYNVLEKKRDGLVYFSEKFILKLVSPKYRINAARRNTIINALETLQYLVFAYRDLKGKWPESFDQIAKEGYINIETIKDPNNFSIDKNGIVSHKEWGSLHKLVSISDVPINEIKKSEKIRYESFRDGYQRFWREFFDPVGVAITVGDQIMLHTIILPLIDNSEYNFVKDIFGGDPVKFSLLTNPSRLATVSLNGKLDINKILYSIGKDSAYYDYRDKESDRLRKELITEKGKEQSINLDYSEIDKKIMSEEDFYKKNKEEDIINKIEEKFFKAIKWEKKNHLNDFIGNEIMIGMGEKNTFKKNNIANLDVFLEIKLKDSKIAQEFVNQIITYASGEIGGGNRMSRLGMFGLSASDPVKNNYNGVDYYIIPTGFINLYYLYIDDSLYITISQLAVNKVIDEKKTIKGYNSTSPNIRRALDYIGFEHNILLNIDSEKIKDWENQLFDFTNREIAEEPFSNLRTYLDEAITLSKSLPKHDDNLGNVDKIYYFNIPKKWMLADIKIEKGKKNLIFKDKIYNMDQIETSYSYRYMTDDKKENGKTQLSEVLKTFDSNNLSNYWANIKNLNIGFSLTKEGVSTKIAFNNNISDKKDPRFTAQNSKEFAFLDIIKKNPTYFIIGISGLIIVFVVLMIIFRRKK